MHQDLSRVDFDYDQHPERFRANVRAVERYGLANDVHEEIADRFAEEEHGLVVDMGCGEGRFVTPARARDLDVIAVDYSATMLAAIADSRVQADAAALPFCDEQFDAAVALYMLYHLTNPVQAIAEAFRVLRPGGLFAACAPSRHNDPELASYLPASLETFDAENGAALIGEFFDRVEVEKWDAPLVHLPDRRALALYLKGRQLEDVAIQRTLDGVRTPLTLTKRGALFYAHKQC